MNQPKLPSLPRKTVMLTASVQRVIETRDELMELVETLHALGVKHIVFTLRDTGFCGGGSYSEAIQWLEVKGWDR